MLPYIQRERGYTIADYQTYNLKTRITNDDKQQLRVFNWSEEDRIFGQFFIPGYLRVENYSDGTLW